MKLLSWTLSAFLAAQLVNADAAITINVDIEGVRDENNLKVPAATNVVVVASSLDGSFSDPVVPGGGYSAGDFISSGSDDVVLGMFNLIDLGATSGNQVAFTNIQEPANVNAGDPIRIMWFPESTGEAGPVAGDNYGAYRESNLSFEVPGPGGTISIAVLTTDATTLGPGAIDPSAVNANLTVIPEPSSTFLSLLGLVFCCHRRRRQ